MNRLEIDLHAVERNIYKLQQHCRKDMRIMVMVKANAYGTDMLAMTAFYEKLGIDIVGVANCLEAVTLRKNGCKLDIFVLHAIESEFETVIDYDLQLAVSNSEQITQLAQCASKKNRHVLLHLNIDTGMRRFGCKPSEALALAEQITHTSHLQLHGVMTHFTSADDPSADSITLEQKKSFDAVLKSLIAKKIPFVHTHAANSSAVSRFRFNDYSMVRIGLSAYGLHASDACREALALEKSLSLFTTIVELHSVSQGETISYGRTYTESKKSATIAVVALGYYDGLHRSYSNNGYALIAGKKAPYVGTICMDYMMLDVTEIPEAKVGSEVLIFGKDRHGNELSCETFSAFGKTIAYEAITSIGPRVLRVFV